MLQKTRGIVLHSLKYGDTGLITTIYTELHGRLSFMMQGTHGKKSAVKANLLRQFSLLEMEVDFKPGRDLQRVKELKIHTPFQSIPYEIAKSTQVLFLAELLNKVLREEEAHPELFEFIFSSILIFDLMEDGIGNFHLIFLLQLTRFLGFAPTNNYTPDYPFFDMIVGKFVLMPPDHPQYLKERGSATLHEILKTNFQNSNNVKIDSELRVSMLQFMLDYYELHIGSKLSLKSLEVVRDILH